MKWNLWNKPVCVWICLHITYFFCPLHHSDLQDNTNRHNRHILSSVYIKNILILLAVRGKPVQTEIFILCEPFSPTRKVSFKMSRSPHHIRNKECPPPHRHITPFSLCVTVVERGYIWVGSAMVNDDSPSVNLQHKPFLHLTGWTKHRWAVIGLCFWFSN